MSALDGFYAAWDNARATFGDGTPQGGAQFDASAILRRLGADVAAAAPGARWSGAAATAYDRRNTEHHAVFGRLADLDQRLAAHVDQAAGTVLNGRRDLDTVRQWVTDAAASVPPGAQRDTMLTQIASRGLDQLGQVVRGANAQLNTIAAGLQGLKTEYDALAFKESPPPPGEDEPADGADRTDMSSGDIEAIDRANREMLQGMLEEYRQLPDGQVRTDRLADIAAIREALKVPGSHLVYLERPDDPSQMIPAATSVGDPFTADHVSVSVPGVSSTTRAAIAGMTNEAAALRHEAASVASRVGESTDIATVAWVGYQPPPSLTSSEVLTDDLAQAGAPKLTSFVQNLDAASHNPGQTTALFGHSYGSLTSGIALQDGASAYVDNAVMYGSPGFQASSTAGLGMRDDNFWVMSAPDDPINSVGAFAPFHGWGANPNDIIDEGDATPRYRFPHLETEAGSTPIPDYESKTEARGHSDYPRDAGERMTGYNLATILLDRPDLAVTETPIS
jgi:hypothetical protein